MLTIDVAEPVNDDFLAVPYATTITSSSCSASDFITTFTFGLIFTSCDCIPMKEMTKVPAELY